MLDLLESDKWNKDSQVELELVLTYSNAKTPVGTMAIDQRVDCL
jgi:hypothetical protein